MMKTITQFYLSQSVTLTYFIFDIGILIRRARLS